MLIATCLRDSSFLVGSLSYCALPGCQVVPVLFRAPLHPTSRASSTTAASTTSTLCNINIKMIHSYTPELVLISCERGSLIISSLKWQFHVLCANMAAYAQFGLPIHALFRTAFSPHISYSTYLNIEEMDDCINIRDDVFGALMAYALFLVLHFFSPSTMLL